MLVSYALQAERKHVIDITVAVNAVLLQFLLIFIKDARVSRIQQVYNISVIILEITQLSCICLSFKFKRQNLMDKHNTQNTNDLNNNSLWNKKSRAHWGDASKAGLCRAVDGERCSGYYSSHKRSVLASWWNIGVYVSSSQTRAEWWSHLAFLSFCFYYWCFIIIKK